LKTPRTLSALVIAVAAFTTACRRDMQDQPKYKPLQKSEFFTDGRSARPIPAGTIAWDELNDNDPEHTGESNGVFLDTIPLPVNETLLRRGQDRFDIFCSPCHGRMGDGNGIVAQRGFRIPANLHTDRLRQVPPGYIFEVISNGYGAMPEHRDQIPVADRWAIVAYVRALQLARDAKVSDVPGEAMNQLGVQK
jgi:hypothetical protein